MINFPVVKNSVCFVVNKMKFVELIKTITLTLNIFLLFFKLNNQFMTKIILHRFPFQTFNLINTLLKHLLSYYYYHQLLGNLVNCVTCVIGIILMTRFSFMFSLRAICIIIISSISTTSRSKFDTNLFSLEIRSSKSSIHFICV